MPTTLRYTYKPRYNQNNLIMETDPTLVLYLPNPNILKQNNDLNPYTWPDYSNYGNHAQIYGATWTKDGLYCDGIDDFACIGLQPNGSGTPFTVYGWNEITIAEWIYPCWPKSNTSWSKFSMIGDYWVDYPCVFFYTNNRTDYTVLGFIWRTRKNDGTMASYGYSFFSYRNSWVHLIRRFTSAREISFWINGSKVYYPTVPADYRTILEQDPETTPYPERFKRFVLGLNSATVIEHMKCMYGEVRIYNRALSDDEIQELYQNGLNERFGKRVYL